jgi:hypothetical protein
MRSMKVRGGVALIALVALLVCVPLVAALPHVRTSVSLNLQVTEDTLVFTGRVSSPRPKCEFGRAVFVESPNATWPRPPFDHSNREGRFKVILDKASAPDGPYHARVVRELVRRGQRGIVCKSARSENVPYR